MMKKLIKQGFGFLAVMLVLFGFSWTLCAKQGSVMPPLETAGELTITLSGKSEGKDVPIVGEILRITQIADLFVDDNGLVTINVMDAFAPTAEANGISFDGMTAGESKIAARILAGAVTEKMGTVLATDENGQVLMIGLNPGIYLVVQESDLSDDFWAMAPYLIMVPGAETDSAMNNIWNYQVTSRPKTELVPKPHEGEELGEIRVTKWLRIKNGNDWSALVSPIEWEFNVGLFTDKDGTNPYDYDGYMWMQTLTIEPGTSHNEEPVVFDELPMGTYYVYELDEMNRPIKDGGSLVVAPFSFTVDHDKGPDATLETGNPVQKIYINNKFNLQDPPPGYYKEAEVQIRKNVMKGGNAYDTSEAFYAGIFAHADDAQPLKVVKLENNDVVTVELDLGGVNHDGSAPVTYYIYEVEVDQNGVYTGKAKENAAFPYKISQVTDNVTVNADLTKGEIVITNTVGESTPTPTPTSKPSVTPTKSPSGGGGGYSGGGGATDFSGSSQGSAARTGDDTNLTGAFALLGGAVLVILILVIVIVKLKRNGKED